MTARARTVFGLELRHLFGRPLFWFLVALLFLMSWGMSTGNVSISSGDASVGGTKAWLTSEFSVAMIVIYMVALVYSFFAAIAAGLTIPADDEAKVGEILHATPLRPGEYVWGKFLAILAGFLAVLAIHLLFSAFFNHAVPDPERAEIRGPFELVNYLRPALVFALPALVFILGVSLFLGERWRRPMAVFLFPTALLVLCGFFLWDWAPTWLDPRINRALMLIDPSGFRWLNETWLKLDRGAGFYNTARIGLDLPFIVSRLAFLGTGLLGVALAQRHLAAHLRGPAGTALPRRLFGRRARPVAAPAWEAEAGARSRSLSALGMSQRPLRFAAATLEVARTELRNLLASPGLYLFTVLILLQAMGNALLALSAFQTKLLLTPGQLAVAAMGPLSAMLSLLLMFYTVESIERDGATGLSAIAYTSPVPTSALLFGKVLANSAVAVLALVATYAGCAIAILAQGEEVGPNPGPFLLVWGLLLLPTFLVWTAFVVAVRAVTGQRFATYGICLAALVFTGYRAVTGGMSWVGNWPLWANLSWSDMGPFELDRRALLLNRLMFLGLAALLVVLAVRVFNRRQADAIGTIHRLYPRELARQAARLSPWAVVPLVAGAFLYFGVLEGYQGEGMRDRAKDYWTQNLATWKDAPQPDLAGVDLSLDLEPARRWFRTRGSYDLINGRDVRLSRFALTGGLHWEKVRWSVNGKPYEPEDRSGLWVFTPPGGLPPGGRLRVGFDYEGVFPKGMSENGGRQNEFILPSGVVLTGFTPSFAPVIGYQEQIGIEEDENDYEPRIYPEDFYHGKTDTLFGFATPFPTRIRISGPEGFTYNSVGTKVSDTVSGGRRTVVWQSDHPVRLFNVVAGRWQERRGRGTVIYHHPGHPYNIDEMSATLDASRRYYSEWFHPFPWKELKLSEFPNLDTYAQGFPTNITFSEGIGFLTRNDEKSDAVFLVTAHEAAHQWWGNILTPGKGPGANILSEGTSHYSTALLMEQVKGPQARMEFLKRLEERYGDERRVDAERPLVLVDGEREADNTLMYDKGGWVFWMLHRHLGRERALAGIRQFFKDWSMGPDYPVLQDFTAALRSQAADPAAYDAFVKQWFHEVVVPEYQLSDARTVKAGDAGGGWRTTLRVKNIGTGRMPVQVAAIRGERFTEDGKPGKGYRDARTTVILGAGEEKRVEILSPFEPEKVLTDPDVEVLQLRRKAALADL
ncbi:MAG TPA: M1 family aminopeptidase [Thermoanaerobaculia bacterium]|nr:M1 family aminopeptidase [Thermoanaerobaculia bacterium]